MAKATQVRFREEPEIKKQAEVILKEIGLDLSSACRLFLRRVIQTRSIPFQMESGYTRKGEQAILKTQRQLEKDRKAGRTKEYPSAKALFDELDRGK